VLVTIGNQNATLSGKQTYVLKYNVQGALNATSTTNAKGGTTKLDEFDWNVTGDEWTVPIDKTTITVTGPTGATDYACAVGPDGSHADCPGAPATSDGAKFSTKEIAAGDGATIDVGRPAGTFTNTAPILEPTMSPDAANVYAGSNDGQTPGTVPTDVANAPVGPAPTSETIVAQYEPPKGFPVGAVSLIMDKQQSKIDVTVTLLDLAARGHLRIEEVPGGARHKATEYTAVRAAILGSVQTGRYFLDKLNRTHPGIGWILGASVATFVVMIFFFADAWTLWPIGAFIGGFASAGFAKRAIRRSALGHATYIELQGFKLYIRTAEADQIHFEEGIDVFSKYLPWATAFGEADHWVGVFAQLAKERKFTTTPDWYIGDQHALTTAGLGGSLAAISSLGAAVSSFSSFASETMSATPHTSSSGGGSGFGGVFGGGGGDFGGGGGGGGSW
jgi:uncharacterized membrane protein YgcG